MDERIFIIDAEQIIDGVSVDQGVSECLVEIKQKHLRQETLTIDPLRAGWDTPIENNHFRSGNAPLLAIERACKILREDLADVVIIQGEDYLRSAYSAQERHELMDIYAGISVPKAYTKLAEYWCLLHGVDKKTFLKLADELFQNYYRTYKKTDSRKLPNEKWFEFITPWFRGVDCANPVVDYAGKIVVATKKAITALRVLKNVAISIKAIATAETQAAGLEGLVEIANYQHLKKILQQANQQAQLDFFNLFKRHQAHLEVYTCFPVVPLAFLHESGLVNSAEEVTKLIQRYPLTITGGMNLAKAAWNMPALHAIIEMYFKLQKKDALPIGAVHGNGGLGEKQGFLILRNGNEISL